MTSPQTNSINMIEETLTKPEAFEQYLNQQLQEYPTGLAGIRNAGDSCPISLWITHLFPDYSAIAVTKHFIQLVNMTEYHCIDTADTWVEQFVTRIDKPYNRHDENTWLVSYQEALQTLHASTQTA